MSPSFLSPRENMKWILWMKFTCDILQGDLDIYSNVEIKERGNPWGHCGSTVEASQFLSCSYPMHSSSRLSGHFQTFLSLLGVPLNQHILATSNIPNSNLLFFCLNFHLHRMTVLGKREGIRINEIIKRQGPNTWVSSFNC